MRHSSLENSYIQFMYSTEAIAKERTAHGDALAKEAATLEETGVRQEAIRKKHHAFNAKLIQNRDHTVQQRESSKKVRSSSRRTALADTTHDDVEILRGVYESGISTGKEGSNDRRPTSG